MSKPWMCVCGAGNRPANGVCWNCRQRRRASEEAPGFAAQEQASKPVGVPSPCPTDGPAASPDVSSDALTWCPVHGTGVPLREEGLYCAMPLVPGSGVLCGARATGPGADAAVRALDLAKANGRDFTRVARERDAAIARAEAAERERDVLAARFNGVGVEQYLAAVAENERLRGRIAELEAREPVVCPDCDGSHPQMPADAVCLRCSNRKAVWRTK